MLQEIIAADFKTALILEVAKIGVVWQSAAIPTGLRYPLVS